MQLKGVFVGVWLGASAIVGAGDVLNEGDVFPALNLSNQFEDEWRMNANVKQIIFSGSKSASVLMGDYLAKQEADWLEKSHRVYMADIHKMPAVITRLVALPKMKKLNYSVVLGRDSKDMAMMPRKEGCLTLLDIDNQHVTAIQWLCTPHEVNRL